MRLLFACLLILSVFQNIYTQNKVEVKEGTYEDYRIKVSPFYNYDNVDLYQAPKIVEVTDDYLDKYKKSMCDFCKIRILDFAGNALTNDRFKDKVDKKKGFEYLNSAILVAPGLFTEDKISSMSNINRERFSNNIESLKRRISFRYCLNWLNSLPEEDLKIYLIFPAEKTISTESYIKSFKQFIAFHLDDNLSWLESFGSIKNTPEYEKLIVDHFKPGIKWYAEKNNLDFKDIIKVRLESEKKTKQDIKEIDRKETSNNARNNYFLLDKIRYKELTKENIEEVAKLLTNEEFLDAKSFQSNFPEWVNRTRVCDYAYLTLEQMVNGNGYAWNRLKYNLKNREKKLEEWRAWWQVSKNMSLEDIGRKAIEQAFNQPASKENPFYLSSVVHCWAGWGFEMRNRVSLNDEKPESIIQEIKTWWETQKDKDIASWKKSISELKDTPKYVKIKENFEVARKTKSDLFNAKRKGEFEKFQKESPELLEFIRTLDKLEYTPEGIKKALEAIKVNKPKLKGTTFEEELEEFEQKLLADPSLIEK